MKRRGDQKEESKMGGSVRERADDVLRGRNPHA